ncbi:hypothetical protein T02_4481 [Trichinella nativa]|uniref:Uncharacterized protein n=1 Tax=Trichinella nativa TaxID=6335 RepID=A0A0V1L8D8_9BILA|nr:hypothetical protein T02_4481 [Trichinella nativa]
MENLMESARLWILIYCYPFAAVLCFTLPLKGIVRFGKYLPSPGVSWRNAAAFSAMSIFKVNREPLFIRLLHLQSGLCHCRVDADVLFVPLGL